MHPIIPPNPNALQLASYAERLASRQHGILQLVFQGIMAVSVGVITTKMIFDLCHDQATKHRRDKSEGRGRG